MCPEWKPQQKILWAEVRKETGRWKNRWKIRDLLANERCSWAVLDFLSTTDVERRVPAEEDAVSEVSEAEQREWTEEQGAGAEGPGAGGNHHCSYPRLTSWRPQGRSRRFPLSLSFVLSFVISLVRVTSSWDRPGRRAKGHLQRVATVQTATDCK